ncbi:MAG: (2Fe-2S)-binding protein, partial [Pseudomonadota bacterium]
MSGRRTAGRRAPSVRFFLDGEAFDAPEGESVAAALMAAGVTRLRAAPRDGAPRGAFCLMGLCQECLVLAEGPGGLAPTEACRLAVREGLSLRRLA